VHLDEEQLQRLLHGETLPRAERSSREHVAGCADCRRRLAEAEREESEMVALFRAMDSPPPPIRAEAVAARARMVAARAHRFAWLRRAASLLVAVGIAGAAYAMPGSPVRGWVDAIVRQIGGRSEPSAVAPVPSDSAAGVSGISVLPGQRLLVLFKTAQDGGQIHVWLTDGPEVQVQAPVGAATFASGADQLLIENRGFPATFEIRIPRDAPWIEIRVGGDPVFRKQGPRVTTTGSASASGGYLLRLTASGS